MLGYLIKCYICGENWSCMKNCVRRRKGDDICGFVYLLSLGVILRRRSKQ
jgi:hypothetical protein